MEAGTAVWVSDATHAWLPAVVVSAAPAAAAAGGSKVPPGSFRVVVRTLTGEERTVVSAGTGGSGELVDVKLANPDDITVAHNVYFSDSGVGAAADTPDPVVLPPTTSALVEDLVVLPFLHEPSILHTLACRYKSNTIYTYTGPILLAVNPFQSLAHLYSREQLEAYYTAGVLRSQKIDTDPLPPHVFSVADASYRAMMDSGSGSGGGGGGVTPGSASGGGRSEEDGGAAPRNQSMLVSGESGAGKTETTKIIMSYLATVGRGGAAISAQPPAPAPLSEAGAPAPAAAPTVEQQVLQSNPILEAFGNAKTLRNENSSRFGKFIQLQFDRRGRLAGAHVSTYLLEKVRLVAVGGGERSFHAFYQLCAGASEQERQRWGLCDDTGGSGEADHHTATPATHFPLTSRGGCLALRDYDDAVGFAATTAGMRVMSIHERDIRRVWSTLAGLLHLSRVEFSAPTATSSAPTVNAVGGGAGAAPQHQQEGSVVAEGGSTASLATAAALLGVSSPAALGSVLTRVRLDLRGEVTYRLLSPAAAADTRDAIIKQVYSRVFDWLVARINDRTRHDEEARSFIGVLDIFGFEHFATNSLEQLCINYANETLQCHFNDYVFRLEQAEYAREGVPFSAVDFSDNLDVLELFEARPGASAPGGGPSSSSMGTKPGLLALLDEACLMPKATDASFAAKALDGCGRHVRFVCTPKMRVEGLFAIRHYAGEVAYSTAGFLDKNRDTCTAEALDLLAGAVGGSPNPDAGAGTPLTGSDSGLAAGSAAGQWHGDDEDYPTGVAVFFSSSPTPAAAVASFPVDVASGPGAVVAPPLRRGNSSRLAAAPPSHPPQPMGGRQGASSSATGAPRQSVGASFKAQLRDLMSTIRSTKSHYIRCLKPNGQSVHLRIDRVSLVSQLRCGGVLEAVRISRMGWPVRLPLDAVFARYATVARARMWRSRAAASGPASGLLSSWTLRRLASGALPPTKTAKAAASDDAAAAAAAITSPSPQGPALISAINTALSALGADNGTTFHAGTTKVFFRRPGYDALEKARNEEALHAVLRIATAARGLLARIHFARARAAVVTLQCFARRAAAMRLLLSLRQERAATALQSAVRRGLARRRFAILRARTLALQSAWRGVLGRRVANALRRTRAALRIQCTYRGSGSRRAFLRLRRSALVLQCAYRSMRARRRLLQLKRDAAEVGSLREEVLVLRGSVRALTSALAEAREQAAAALAATAAALSIAEVGAMQGGLAADAQHPVAGVLLPAEPPEAEPPASPATTADANFGVPAAVADDAVALDVETGNAAAAVRHAATTDNASAAVPFATAAPASPQPPSERESSLLAELQLQALAQSELRARLVSLEGDLESERAVTRELRAGLQAASASALDARAAIAALEDETARLRCAMGDAAGELEAAKGSSATALAAASLALEAAVARHASEMEIATQEHDSSLRVQAAAQRAAIAALEASLRDEISESLRAELSDSLRAEISESMRTHLVASLRDELVAALRAETAAEAVLAREAMQDAHCQTEKEKGDAEGPPPLPSSQPEGVIIARQPARAATAETASVCVGTEHDWARREAGTDAVTTVCVGTDAGPVMHDWAPQQTVPAPTSAAAGSHSDGAGPALAIPSSAVVTPTTAADAAAAAAAAASLAAAARQRRVSSVRYGSLPLPSTSTTAAAIAAVSGATMMGRIRSSSLSSTAGWGSGHAGLLGSGAPPLPTAPLERGQDGAAAGDTAAAPPLRIPTAARTAPAPHCHIPTAVVMRQEEHNGALSVAGGVESGQAVGTQGAAAASGISSVAAVGGPSGIPPVPAACATMPAAAAAAVSAPPAVSEEPMDGAVAVAVVVGLSHPLIAPAPPLQLRQAAAPPLRAPAPASSATAAAVPGAAPRPGAPALAQRAEPPSLPPSAASNHQVAVPPSSSVSSSSNAATAAAPRRPQGGAAVGGGWAAPAPTSGGFSFAFSSLFGFGAAPAPSSAAPARHIAPSTKAVLASAGPSAVMAPRAAATGGGAASTPSGYNKPSANSGGTRAAVPAPPIDPATVVAVAVAAAAAEAGLRSSGSSSPAPHTARKPTHAAAAVAAAPRTGASSVAPAPGAAPSSPPSTRSRTAAHSATTATAAGGAGEAPAVPLPNGPPLIGSVASYNASNPQTLGSPSSASSPASHSPTTAQRSGAPELANANAADSRGDPTGGAGDVTPAKRPGGFRAPALPMILPELPLHQKGAVTSPQPHNQNNQQQQQHAARAAATALPHKPNPPSPVGAPAPTPGAPQAAQRVHKGFGGSRVVITEREAAAAVAAMKIMAEAAEADAAEARSRSSSKAPASAAAAVLLPAGVGTVRRERSGTESMMGPLLPASPPLSAGSLSQAPLHPAAAAAASIAAAAASPTQNSSGGGVAAAPRSERSEEGASEEEATPGGSGSVVASNDWSPHTVVSMVTSPDSLLLRQFVAGGTRATVDSPALGGGAGSSGRDHTSNTAGTAKVLQLQPASSSGVRRQLTLQPHPSQPRYGGSIAATATAGHSMRALLHSPPLRRGASETDEVTRVSAAGGAAPGGHGKHSHTTQDSGEPGGAAAASAASLEAAQGAARAAQAAAAESQQRAVDLQAQALELTQEVDRITARATALEAANHALAGVKVALASRLDAALGDNQDLKALLEAAALRERALVQRIAQTVGRASVPSPPLLLPIGAVGGPPSGSTSAAPPLLQVRSAGDPASEESESVSTGNAKTEAAGFGLAGLHHNEYAPF